MNKNVFPLFEKNKNTKDESKLYLCMNTIMPWSFIEKRGENSGWIDFGVLEKRRGVRRSRDRELSPNNLNNFMKFHLFFKQNNQMINDD